MSFRKRNKISVLIVSALVLAMTMFGPVSSAYADATQTASGNSTGALSAIYNCITAAGTAGVFGGCGGVANLITGASSSSGSCDGITNFFSSPISCAGVAASTFIGSSLVWLSSWILALAGLLFNWVFNETILQFGSVVNSGVITAINIAWSAFRDVSNILIIGLFAFIAIMTILGNTEYGYKKMLSRVLIVAVLINFSLLFTKIIIDVSDFTAVQFFNACAQCTQQNSTSGTIASGSNSTQTGDTSGIAGAFMQYAGASSFSNTYSTLWQVGKNPQNGGWYVLLYGVVISLLELVAAIVLFYGSFLLISRAVLMIILMITSSIAFASYLLPSGWQSSAGWSLWWQTLLKNAVFAPLLAIMLWVTLTVSQAFYAYQVSQGVTTGLGSLTASASAANAPSSLGVAALFGYLLVIALLYISFRLSSSFASSVGGLNIAQSAWDRLAHTSFGVLRDQTIGRWAGGRAELKTAQAQQNRTRGSDRLASAAALYGQGAAHAAAAERRAAAQAFRSAASNTLTAARYGAIANANALKLPGSTTKALPGSNAEEQAHVRNEAQGDQREAIQQQKEAMISAAKESAEAAGKALEKSKNELATNNPAYTQARDDLAAAEKARDEAAREHDEVIKQIESQFTSATGANERALIQKQISESAESHKSEMRQRDQQIEEARARTREIESRSDAVQQLQKVYDQKVKDLEQHQTEKTALSGTAATSTQSTPPDDSSVVASYRRGGGRAWHATMTGGRSVQAEVIPPNSQAPVMHTDAVIHDNPTPQRKAA